MSSHSTDLWIQIKHKISFETEEREQQSMGQQQLSWEWGAKINMSAENNTNIYMLQQQYIVMSTPLQVDNHDNSYEETRIHEVKYIIC